MFKKNSANLDFGDTVLMACPEKCCVRPPGGPCLIGFRPGFDCSPPALLVESIRGRTVRLQCLQIAAWILIFSPQQGHLRSSAGTAADSSQQALQLYDCPFMEIGSSATVSHSGQMKMNFSSCAGLAALPTSGGSLVRSALQNLQIAAWYLTVLPQTGHCLSVVARAMHFSKHSGHSYSCPRRSEEISATVSQEGQTNVNVDPIVIGSGD